MCSTTVQDGLQVVLVLACGSALASAGHALGRTERLSASPELEQLIGAGLSLVGVMIIAAWIATLVIALLAAVLQRTGRPATARVAARVAVVCTPAVARRLAVTLVGVNLLAMPAVAQASPGSMQIIAQQAPAATPVAVSTGSAAPSVAGVAAGSTSADEGTAPGMSGSPYWSVDPLPEPAGPSAPGPDGGTRSSTPEANEQMTPAPGSAPAAPARSGWTPTPIPVDGGLLLRQEMRSTAGPSEVVVVPGDSLWSIVAAHLGPSAGSAEVAEAWPAWFEANRTVIGDDPSLLVPGQVLRSPEH
jgi:nucleoid-associated protein YgaU